VSCETLAGSVTRNTSEQLQRVGTPLCSDGAAADGRALAHRPVLRCTIARAAGLRLRAGLPSLDKPRQSKASTCLYFFRLSTPRRCQKRVSSVTCESGRAGGSAGSVRDRAMWPRQLGLRGGGHGLSPAGVVPAAWPRSGRDAWHLQRWLRLAQLDKAAAVQCHRGAAVALALLPPEQPCPPLHPDGFRCRRLCLSHTETLMEASVRPGHVSTCFWGSHRWRRVVRRPAGGGRAALQKACARAVAGQGRPGGLPGSGALEPVAAAASGGPGAAAWRGEGWLGGAGAARGRHQAQSHSDRWPPFGSSTAAC